MSFKALPVKKPAKKTGQKTDRKAQCATLPILVQIGLIKLLLLRCFSLCSDFIKFHHGLDKLKSILYKTSYPSDLVDKYIK